jgi:uncharacterized protein YjbJ (UPF0337 family)
MRMSEEAKAMSGHEVEDMKGRLKEAVGDVTGNEGLKREGKIDRASAAVEDTVDKAAAKIKDAVNPKK